MANKNLSKLLTDGAILTALGERITRHRIRLELTQAQLASQAGVSKRTIERIESGHSAQMLSMIRTLRVLELLPGLDQLIPEIGLSPMDLLRQQGKRRQRASSTKRKDGGKDQEWSWDDEK